MVLRIDKFSDAKIFCIVRPKEVKISDDFWENKLNPGVPWRDYPRDSDWEDDPETCNVYLELQDTSTEEKEAPRMPSSEPQTFTIIFTDEDLPKEDVDHNRPLYVSGYVCEVIISRMLVHGGSAMNILPLQTLKMLGISTDTILWSLLYNILIVVYAFVQDIVALLLTSARDPGIVPRNAHPPETEVELSPLGTPPSRLPRSKNVYANGLIVKVKYCDTCMLYRPPRCSHCSTCNNCVDKFDHHCPWIGQCIGLRNYRFYFMFVSTSTLLCLYIHGFCWVYVIKIMNSEKTTIWKAFIDTPASMLLTIYTFLLVWFVGGLTIFHLYLISTNQSTYENFRYRYDQRINPYNKGVSRNFLDVFCTSIPPSKNNFRAKVQKESELSSRVGEGAFSHENMGITESNNMDNGKKVKPGSSWGRSGNWEVPPEAVSTASEIGDSDRFTIAGDSSRRYARQSSKGSINSI